MKDALYWIVYRMADIHDYILTLNDGMEQSLSDKQLHFLIIGLTGMVLFLFIHPLFKYLCKKGMVIFVSLLYVLTLIVVLTFGIEVGQQVTKTGRMEFADIVSGVAGFFVAFAIYLVLVGAVKLVRKLLHR